jgi:cation-transporting ATPase 13A1
MYKILALNCLITAFCLSALYLDGIKYGDTQITTQGFLLAGCFMFLSWGKPIERLSRKRPQPNIFNAYILTSVLGQFAVHAITMWTVVVETKKLLPEDWKPDLDDETSKFEPNLLNTTVYLISLAMQVSTFLINYQGRPFRESLRENKALYFSLTGLYGLAIFCAAQIFPELNEYVELVPMEPSFSDFMVKSILLDFAGAYAVEYVSNLLFSDHRPPRSLGLEDAAWENLERFQKTSGRSIDADGELIVKAKTNPRK